ncbi:transglycosylase SLT domain-containing protein [Halomonas salipaludis]|nr:transglycosylase SLT domain-containing protein [Halomonas salipaludis]
MRATIWGLKAYRRMVMGCAVGCSLAVLSSLANATVVPPAYFDAASLHQVPPEVLYAVATAESVVSLKVGRRPWPWTLNVAGEGFQFATREAACDALLLALEETRLVDVGITQLNVRWQPQLFGAGKRFSHPCDALNPYANLEEAARLLRGHFDATGDWVQAAGRYHRPAGGEPAARYRRIVATELERLRTSRQRQLAAN